MKSMISEVDHRNRTTSLESEVTEMKQMMAQLKNKDSYLESKINELLEKDNQLEAELQAIVS